jgi:hypothetical protein
MKPAFVDNRNGSTLVVALREHLVCSDKRFATVGIRLVCRTYK